MNKKDIVGGLIASAVASLILSAPALADQKADAGSDAKAEWYCSNSCKGKSDCMSHGNKNGCSHQNSCKGQGYFDAKDKSDCAKKGGTWKQEEKKK